MLILAIVLHVLLISALIYRRAWYGMFWLVFIALLGLAFSPLLHYEYSRLSDQSYLFLYYGIDGLMGLLYLISILKLRTTPLALISLSQLMYLSLKVVAWVFLILSLTEARVEFTMIMRVMNLFFIAFWILVVWFDGNPQKGKEIYARYESKQSSAA